MINANKLNQVKTASAYLDKHKKYWIDLFTLPNSFTFKLSVE